MKVFLLSPFILLVQILAGLDPKLFRDWDLTSLDNWHRGRTSWKAYVISLTMWASAFGCRPACKIAFSLPSFGIMIFLVD
jgi:hypothetical protein